MVFSGRIIQSSVAAATLVVVLAQSPEDYLKQASTMVARHEMDQAMEILDRGLQAFPHNPDVLTQFGLLLVMAGNLEAGDELLSRALAIRPLDHRALQGRAEAQLRQGALSRRRPACSSEPSTSAPRTRIHAIGWRSHTSLRGRIRKLSRRLVEPWNRHP